MTVGIAAISQGMVFLASDRMLTAGDIQFQPAARKTFFATSSIAILFSGQAAFHAEVAQEVVFEVQRHVQQYPEVWLHVKDVALMYIKHRNLAKLRRAESALLAPLGLDVPTYLSAQDTLNSDLAQSLARDLINYEVPTVEVIVAGIDTRHGDPRPSLYSIYNGDLVCHDSISFASIGSGARHAESQFMLDAHAFSRPGIETLFTLYSAKKAAEIAPGVGDQTDLFSLGPGLGQSSVFPEILTEKLDQVYRKARDDDKKARDGAASEIQRFVEEALQQQAEQQESSGPEADKPSPIEEGSPEK